MFLVLLCVCALVCVLAQDIGVAVEKILQSLFEEGKMETAFNSACKDLVRML
jgi:hypothetical protein